MSDEKVKWSRRGRQRRRPGAWSGGLGMLGTRLLERRLKTVFERAGRRKLSGIACGDDEWRALWGRGKSDVEERADLYEKHRHTASSLGSQMSSCFSRSRVAWFSGDRLEARSLADQGHKYRSEMRTAHEDASRRIFQERNPDGTKHRVLDLHGLHVEEAIERVRQELSGAAPGSVFRIVTGHGRHSRAALERRLVFCVKQFLGKHHLVKDVLDAEGNVGSYQVHVKK